MITFLKTTDGITSRLDHFEDGCWVNAVAPDADEQVWLLNQLQIPEEFLKSALDEEESSHIENDDDMNLIICDIPFAEKGEDGIFYYTMPLGVISSQKFILTVSIKDNSIIHEFVEGMVKNVNTQLRTRFVLQFLLKMATRYLQYLKQIDKRSTLLEMQLRRSMRNKELIGLLDLEKSLVYFQTSLKANAMTLEKITTNRFIKLYDDDKELLEDVMIEIKQAMEMSNIYISILSGTMDAFASVISNNLNIVMKVLTALTIVMSIPTIIFSFYGMNIGTADALPGNSSILIPLIITGIATGIAAIILWVKGMFK